MPYPFDEPGRPAAWQPEGAARQSPRPFEPYYTPTTPRKFRNRLWLHITLFVLTLYSTTVVGGSYYFSYITQFGRVRPPFTLAPFPWLLLDPDFLVTGLWYSLTVLAILGAHEMGHYLYCRRYNVDASLPYFIPAPVPLTGTLGAVIRIREPFPTRKVLFDVGVGGPIAGFVVLVPALFIGMAMSSVALAPTGPGVIEFGEPLLFRWVAYLFFGAIPAKHTLNLHPMVWAAWFGMLATAINLLPFGQLDGGHITYAALDRWSTTISFLTVGTAILLTYNSTSWLFMTVMMVVMLLLFGARHPRVLYDYEPLPPSRYVIAAIALVIFIICFTPVPIDMLVSS